MYCHEATKVNDLPEMPSAHGLRYYNIAMARNDVRVSKSFVKSFIHAVSCSCKLVAVHGHALGCIVS